MSSRTHGALCAIALGYALLLAAPNAHALTWQSIIMWIKNTRSEMSAWNIAVKQTGVSADQQAMANQRAQQQLATSIGAIEMSTRMVRAATEFSGTLGQPDTVKCVAQHQAAVQAAAWEQVSHDRARLMGTFAAGRVASANTAERERVALHRDSYCTVGEARSGMCVMKPNGMQGWDSNYGGAFGERTLAAEGELAGYAYAAMVADTRAPAALDCKSSACAAAASEQLALAAAGTMVADAFVGQVLERRIPVITGQ